MIQTHVSDEPLSIRSSIGSSGAKAKILALLMFDYRIKVCLDLQAYKSSVVVKGSFFP
jgi:hypothetical protein